MVAEKANTAATARQLDRETAVARRKKAPPRGASVMDLISALERDHPDLAEAAPVSSAAVEVGDLVKRARLAAGMRQSALAAEAGLHQSALSTIERGEGKDGPTYRNLRAIANALGMEIALVPRGGARTNRGALTVTGERSPYENLPPKWVRQVNWEETSQEG